MAAAWHALLAPLPDDAVANRRPVASPEILATPDGAAIFGWQELVVELSAGTEGLRIVLVVVNATGRPILASDTVLRRRPDQADGSIHMLQDSIGGRIEANGAFRGKCWRTEGPEPADGQQPQWNMQPSEPTESQIRALMALVADVLGRQP